MSSKLTKLLLYLLAVCVPVIWAQTTGGTLSGTVKSPSGTPVANAAVTITNINTNASQRALTGNDGSFTISGLTPGTYRLDVESSGYKRTTQQNVDLTATGPVAINLTLEPGSTAETVEIKGHAPMIQTDNSQMAIGLTTRTVGEIPVPDRNHQDLVNLQPGITPPEIDFPLTTDPARNREWRTNGQAYYNNLPSVEGLSNLEPYRGTAIRVVPNEAVRQFNIVSSNADANQGYRAGAITNVLTKPGTNDWHGSLFEFFNSDILNANNPLNPSGVQPRLTYNQFGATAGGSIVRDKFFFFGSYEGNYNRGESTTVASAPTAAMLGGNFSGVPGVSLFNPATGTAAGLARTPFTNNMIPSRGISPFASALIPYIPTANLPGFANNYVANLPYTNDWQKLDGRIDAHFTDKTQAFLRYGYSNTHATENSLFGQALGLGDSTRLLGQNAVIDLTHTFSPSLAADTRFGYNRYNLKQFGMGNQGPIASALGLTNAPASFLPNIQIAGLSSGFAANGYPFTTPLASGGFTNFGSGFNTPEDMIDNTFNWNASGAWHSSRHNVKFGVDVLHFRTDGFSNLYYGPLGTVEFGPGATLLATNNLNLAANSVLANSWASFLLGTPTSFGSTQFATAPTARQTYYSAWAGDTINLFGRLTIDLGVRWDVFSPLTPRHAGGAQYYNPATNSLLGIDNSNVLAYDTDNIAPRVGLAFRVTNKTAIRAGYGINYFQVPVAFTGFMPATFGNFSGVSGGFTTAPGFNANGLPALTTATPPAAGAPAPNGPLNVLAYSGGTMKTPYVQEFNAQIQQELPDQIVLQLGYVGNLARRLPYNYELNAGLPGTGTAGLPLASIGRTASTQIYTQGLSSNYNALQAQLTKRMGHGLSFQAAYTYSKALNYTTESGMLLNPFNLRANYGPADYDRTQMLTIGHVWDLPFGTGTQHMNHGIVGQILGNWAIDGKFTWATGTPFSVFANPLFYGGANGIALANINGPVSYTNALSLNQPFFNTAAFAPPAFGSFGNQSRNMLRGPSVRTYNFALFKTFAFMEHYRFELRGEAYNLTNSPWYSNPVANLNAPNFGESSGLWNGATDFAGGRQVDLALRLVF